MFLQVLQGPLYGGVFRNIFVEEPSVVEESEWKENLSRAEELVGESKDAPIMAAFLTERVDVLVTSNESDFPVEDMQDVQTPTEFLEKL